MDKNKKHFKIALVGCGAISGSHINGILAAKQTICALCDTDIEKAKQLALKYNLLGINFYSEFSEMLEKEDIEVLHICTPHYLHAEMCIAALSKNINVFCEKPLCISKNQLSDIIEAQKNSSAQLGVCLQNRYEPNMIKLKELSSSGVAGALGIVAWNRDEKYYNSGAWRGKWDTEGGGVMINQALHTLDLMAWICGEPKKVIANISNNHLQNIIEVEDTATAIFETADGTIFNIFATTACATDFPAQIHIKTKGNDRLYADNKLITLNNTPLTVEADFNTKPDKAVWGTGHTRIIDDFYSCLKSGNHFPINAEEGGRVVRLILALYASKGKKIDIF